MDGLRLTIATPSAIIVDCDVRAVRAEDISGDFGILPGHADFLTVLSDCVVRWRDAPGSEHFCVVRSGAMTVTGGAKVEVACRQGVSGDDLAALLARVAALRHSEKESGRRARVEQTQLHARAVRQLMRYLRPTTGATALPPDFDR